MSRGLPAMDKDSRASKQLGEIPPVWKTYLYHLQQQAPTPKRILCHFEITNRPNHYGREFHGKISREDVNRLLLEEGSYLVRESQRAPEQYTLSMRFQGCTKNFKLYFDGKHYVGEKRFDTVQDLVADGLIMMFLESRAGNYISAMHQESSYVDSPYMTLNPYRRKLWKMHMRSIQKMNEAAKQQKSGVISGVGYLSPGLEAFIIHDEDEQEEIDVQQFEKPHSFKTCNFKGLPWCDYCGNFMWGIIAQGVKCEDCGFSAHRRCSEKIPNECLPDLKHVKRIFGVDLTTLVKAHNTLRPFVVDMCVNEIEHRGLDTEGLYRVSGFSDSIEAVKVAFEKDGERAEIGKNLYEDVHIITGVLKLFLRLLPIPLISYDTYASFIHSIRCPHLDEKISGLKQSVNKLPPAHYQTLKFFMAHLSRVTDRHKTNLMTPHNISTILCPTLLRSPEIEPADQLASWQLESEAVELLIIHQKKLFVN